MKEVTLALDQGTSVSKCVVFDEALTPIRQYHSSVPLILGKNGEIEQSPEEILNSAITVIKRAIGSLRPGERIRSLGISNQRETFLIWDRHTGKPVHNAIMWEDRRTDLFCHELRMKHGKAIKDKTGLIPDAYFSGSKIRWLLKKDGDLIKKGKKGDAIFGTVDTWLLWNLTGGRIHATDHTNASRTMLFNINSLEWDADLLDLMEVPHEMLPELQESSSHYGNTSLQILGVEIPVTALIGDQQASVLGHSLNENGDTKVTYGSGAFLVQNTGSHRVRSERLLETLLFSGHGERLYALEGPVFWAGKLIDFIAGLTGSGKEELYGANPARIFNSFPPAVIVPSIEGTGAPYWENITSGTVFGLRAMTNRQNLMDSALASIALQINDIVEELDSIGRKPREIMVDGGLAMNRQFLGFQSAVMDIPVKIGMEPQLVTARGAACAASGYNHCSRPAYQELKVEPPELKKEDIELLIRLWKRAVSRSIEFYTTITKENIDFSQRSIPRK